MKSKNMTIETQNAGLMTLNMDEAVWTISCIKCGMVFKDIALIHQPKSPNPIWEFPKPFGENGILEAINLVNLAKKQQ